MFDEYDREDEEIDYEPFLIEGLDLGALDDGLPLDDDWIEHVLDEAGDAIEEEIMQLIEMRKGLPILTLFDGNSRSEIPQYATINGQRIDLSGYFDLPRILLGPLEDDDPRLN